MNYHNILHDDMLNGNGLRVVLFVSGCNHYCNKCQNPQTWDCNGGILFNKEAIEEIYEQLNKDYISGITFSGGDPLYESNRYTVLDLIEHIKRDFQNKSIWLYTGYKFEDIQSNSELMKIISKIDVLVDGEYVEELSDINYPWAGSTNQRVIDIQKTILRGDIVLWETNINVQNQLNN